MTEWQVFGVLTALTAFVSIFVGIGITYAKTTTELNVTLKELRKFIDDFKESNGKSHQRIFDKLDEQDDVMAEHDKRITKLEDKREH
ncbi:MAG: hypothetical protein RR614_13285 [Eubacterium sp.]